MQNLLLPIVYRDKSKNMKRKYLSLLLLLAATLTVTAQISPEMQKHIRQAEGCSLAVYMDEGYLAVGYGHRLRDDDVEWLRDLELYDEITQEAAELIFRLDMSRLVADGLIEVRKEIGNDFPQGVYDVMGSLIYNMGLDGLRSTQFWQLFREGRYIEARDRPPFRLFPETAAQLPGFLAASHGGRSGFFPVFRRR